MTLKELKSLTRGDVVRWENGSKSNNLGLVTSVRKVGVYVMWELNGLIEGPYATQDDAAQLEFGP